MKKLIAILLIVLLPSVGCRWFSKQIEALFEITSWHQQHHEYYEEWDEVKVYYQIENIGDVTIDYYKVDFEVTCQDGSKLYGYDELVYGPGIEVGEKRSDYCDIDVVGKKAVSVKIIDWKLKRLK